ncbi:6767_t:CDS:1, partial [Cetraspora pellucida]
MTSSFLSKFFLSFLSCHLITINVSSPFLDMVYQSGNVTLKTMQLFRLGILAQMTLLQGYAVLQTWFIGPSDSTSSCR